MRKISLLLLLVIFYSSSFGVTLNPSTFTVNNLNAVANGEVVNLESGVYTITQSIIDAWASSTKSNVTYQRTGTGVVEMDASQFVDQPSLEFLQWSNLTIKDITFTNLEVRFDECTGSTMDNLTFSGQQFSGNYSRNFSIRVLGGANCTVKNCELDWTFTGFNGLGIKVNGGTNHSFLNNEIKGRLVSGIVVITGKKANNNQDPVTNHIIEGGSVVREISTGEEDHGIYIHNISHVQVKGVTFSGWTDNAGGQGIKIKGANHIEVTGCEFTTSAIIIRVASNWPDANDHIWIHNNIFNDGIISSWTNLDDGFSINNSAVIEKNFIANGNVKMLTEDSSSVNSFNLLANRNGGVFDNCTASPNELVSGINTSGNTIIQPGEGLCDCNFTNAQIDFSDFESGWGIWNDGGSDARRSASDAAHSVGTYSIRLRDNTGTSVMTTDVLDLSSFEQITVDFTYLARSMDNSNEDFWLQVSTNGGNTYTTVEEWNTNDEFVNNVREYDTVTVYGPFTDNVKLRFRCDASGPWDFIYIDNVNISGCTLTGATPVARIKKDKPFENSNIELKKEGDVQDLKVYPNPVNNHFNINLGDREGSGQIRMYNLSGKLVFTKRINEPENILNVDASVLKSGLYLINVQIGSISKTLKIIKD